MMPPSREGSIMRKYLLIAACLALTPGLSGCQPNPNARYTLWYQGVPTEFASPYDDPSMYRGGAGGM
jgi:hypothetical protein